MRETIAIIKHPFVAATALAMALVAMLGLGPTPASADHCVYSGGGWLCGGGDPTDPYHLNDPGNDRIAGDNRYSTAAAVSQEFWEPGEAATVYIANGWTPDALAGGASVDGPILLVNYGTELPASTEAELERLDPTGPVKVKAIGGAVSVSQAQIDAATAIAND